MWERGGQTTRSFERWLLAERQLRAFLEFGLRFGDEGLSRRWAEIERRHSYGAEETIDIFDRELQGLGPHEFEWMHAAATLRDAVTLYEVYLEHAAGEVLFHHGLERTAEEAPRWRELRRFYLFLGIDLYAEEGVKNVRRLRHLLTHRRGAVETEADREAFGSDYPFTYETVELNDHRVVTAMDILARSVLRIDTNAYRYSWGSERVPELRAMRASLPDDENDAGGSTSDRSRASPC